MTAALAPNPMPHAVRADARDELHSLRREVLHFVDRAWPHLSALERVAAEIGPVAFWHALALGSLLAHLETQQLADDPATSGSAHLPGAPDAHSR